MEALGLLSGLLALAWWLKARRAETAARQELCGHEGFRFASLDNAGVWWSKICDRCGWQEPYKRTVPPRSHPDNPRCVRSERGLCVCETYCEADPEN